MQLLEHGSPCLVNPTRGRPLYDLLTSGRLQAEN